jgi:hypothetical protein
VAQWRRPAGARRLVVQPKQGHRRRSSALRSDRPLTTRDRSWLAQSWRVADAPGRLGRWPRKYP